jgi:hypothetical protein
MIHNQCSYFELVSPEYLGHDIIWYMLPDQKVNANTMTSASFGKSIVKSDFILALIYKLQKKSHNFNNQSNTDSTKDISTNIQLVVVWIPGEGLSFHVNAMLIEHIDTITWDEEKLVKLCYRHRTPSKRALTIEDTWLLDDVSVLKTISRRNGEKYATEITISEGTKNEETIKPLFIPSNI